MTADRIIEIRIEGLRVFQALRLDVRGLSVLIGDNGTGKSTLLEAFEILRKAATTRDFAVDVAMGQHGPFRELVRVGGDRLTLGVIVEGAGSKIDYQFTLLVVGGGGAVIIDERMRYFDERGLARQLITRDAAKTLVYDQRQNQLGEQHVAPGSLALPQASQGFQVHVGFARLADALSAIEYQPGFDVRPLWQQRELQVREGPRMPCAPEPAPSLRRYAHKLPAALLALRNHGGETWETLIQRARAAVGAELVDIAFEPAGAGQLDVLLKFRQPRPALPVRSLSEGQLAYLAMLAAVALGDGRSVLLLDEPDIHYHPELSVNLMMILEDLSKTCPVIVATHSDRMLDALENPAGSVLLCERRPEDGAVQLRRPSEAALQTWLDRYRGLGSVRAAGYESHVFDGGEVASTEPKP